MLHQRDPCGPEIVKILARLINENRQNRHHFTMFYCKLFSSFAVSFSKRCVHVCDTYYRNDEKFNDLKASFKQQLSPGASTSSKRFEFEATSSEQSNYHLNNHSHTNSSFDSTNNSHGSTTITQTHTISPPHRTAQNVLTVTHSPEHKLHDNLEEHPLVRELSQRGLTQSCKKRKTQSDVKREVESKTLFKS